MSSRQAASRPLSEMESLVAELHKNLATTGGTVMSAQPSASLKANIWIDHSNGVRYKVTHVFQEAIRVIEIRTDNSSDRREFNRFLFEDDIQRGILVKWVKQPGDK